MLEKRFFIYWVHFSVFSSDCIHFENIVKVFILLGRSIFFAHCKVTSTNQCDSVHIYIFFEHLQMFKWKVNSRTFYFWIFDNENLNKWFIHTTGCQYFLFVFFSSFVCVPNFYLILIKKNKASITLDECIIQRFVNRFCVCVYMCEIEKEQK